MGIILRVKGEAINKYHDNNLATTMGNQNLGLPYLLESMVQGTRVRDYVEKQERKEDKCSRSASCSGHLVAV